MTSKHTPGPWILTDGGRFESSCVITTHLRLDESMASIEEVETDWIEPFGSEQQANTLLIAAAPDLLEALKACAAICAGESMSKSSLVRALEMARSAITKATGEIP